MFGEALGESIAFTSEFDRNLLCTTDEYFSG
jgi:hypothetical protein